MISQKKTLLVFNVNNVVDIITNSSSELFVLEGQTKEIVEEMIKNVYPDYLNEYEDVQCLRDASSAAISTYYGWVVESWMDGIWNKTRGMKEEDKIAFEIQHYTQKAKEFNMQPEEFYDNWDSRNSKYFSPDISEEGLQKIAQTLDPDGKIFLLYSLDENPNWDMQEKLMEIGTRYHLG